MRFIWSHYFVKIIFFGIILLKKFFFLFKTDDIKPQNLIQFYLIFEAEMCLDGDGSEVRVFLKMWAPF